VIKDPAAHRIANQENIAISTQNISQNRISLVDTRMFECRAIFR